LGTLYEIDERLRALETIGIDTETGEVAETQEDFERMYDEIEMDLNAKIENTIKFIKNIRIDALAIKDEERKLKERREGKEKFAQRLQDRLDYYIKKRIFNPSDKDYENKVNKYKFETPSVYLSYRKSTKVNVINQDKIPKEYIKTKEETSVDKVKIKKSILSGINVDGVELCNELNMQIK